MRRLPDTAENLQHNNNKRQTTHKTRKASAGKQGREGHQFVAFSQSSLVGRRVGSDEALLVLHWNQKTNLKSYFAC